MENTIEIPRGQSLLANRYLIIADLGTGGHADVKLAHDT